MGVLQNVGERVIPYGAVTDSGEILTSEMHSLYLLSFLLTADKEKADKCFIAGLGAWSENGSAFTEWLRVRARRAIVEQAIHAISPAPEVSDDWSLTDLTKSATVQKNLFAAILSLSAFKRFVFVMSILEGQSDGDCLTLLNCSRQQIEIARELVLRFFVTVDSSGDHFHGSFHVRRLFLNSPR